VRCTNRACSFFDASWANRFEERKQAEPARPHRNPRTGERIAKSKAAKSFDPGGGTIQVRYRNFRGEEKTFNGYPRTMRRRGNHISLCVGPSGVRLALARGRILNLDEVDALVSRTPSAREQWIMAYHKKRGTTSPLLELLRIKYPDW
jgi:hypothetical protein